MIEKARNKAHSLLRKSEKYTKTDMVYVVSSGFWLGFMQVISAFIAFGSSLVFANYVSKDIYGNYKYIIAVTSVLGSITLTGMGSVVSQGVAQGLEGILKKAVRTTLIWGFSVVSVLAIFLSIYYFLHANYILSSTILISGILFPISQAYTLYGNYLVGKKDFKRVAIYALISQFLNTLAVIIVATTTKSVVVMIFVYFFLNTLTTVWAYKRITKQFHINTSNDNSLISYGKHLSVMGFIGTLANQFDKVLIFHYLGAIQLAIYSFSQAIPDQLKGILKNIFGIALPKYANLEETRLRASVSKKSIQLTIFTAIVVAVFILLAPFIFKIFFPKYMEAVFYSQIYMLGLITIPGISLFATYFQLKRATKKIYELNIIGNASTLIITFFLIYRFGLVGAVIANGTSWLVMLLTHWYYFVKHKEVV